MELLQHQLIPTHYLKYSFGDRGWEHHYPAITGQQYLLPPQDYQIQLINQRQIKIQIMRPKSEQSNLTLRLNDPLAQLY